MSGRQSRLSLKRLLRERLFYEVLSKAKAPRYVWAYFPSLSTTPTWQTFGDLRPVLQEAIRVMFEEGLLQYDRRFDGAFVTPTPAGWQMLKEWDR